ncbi:hypothetical protein NLG97_g4424 [Lecanicillium saksenae]|uniref:Uncharacterized protein n=1 Tax=Lecanicillium saksenae TaxID=468837 RepID=A0ACC1QZ81_9HYPO|nr:hypothetical protein NLG97_g4424 [Lecanicillium saksenae]
MKVIYPTVFLAIAASAADIGALLQQAGPLLKQAKCALPCVYKAANDVGCNGSGPIDAICDNLGQIKSASAPCVKKCGIEARHKDAVYNGVTVLCKKRKPQ